MAALIIPNKNDNETKLAFGYLLDTILLQCSLGLHSCMSSRGPEYKFVKALRWNLKRCKNLGIS